MKDLLLQYAPVALFLVMMFIDKFGFGKMFSSFRKDISDAFDIRSLSSDLLKMKSEMGSVISELKEVREEIKKARDAIRKIKGGK